MDIIQYRKDYNIKNEDELKEQLIRDFSFAGFEPEIKFEEELIYIHLDDAILGSTMQKYDMATDLCNRGMYDKAIPLYKEVVRACPLHVDAYRSMAQAYMMMKDLDNAVDYNLKALRIDAGNVYALILMGNIFGMRNDIDSAVKYFEKVLTFQPDNIMAMNNIGGMLLKQGKTENAIKYFKKVQDADPSYMNTYYGIAVAYSTLGEHLKAWESARDGLMNAEERMENPNLMKALTQIYLEEAQKIEDSLNTDRTIANILKDIKEKYGDDVRIENDNTLGVCAKLQYAPSSGRKFHVVKYNDEKKHHAHLIVHEFMHLYMMLEASRQGRNFIVLTDDKNEEAFDTRFEKFFDNMSVRLGNKATDKFRDSMFRGFVLMLMNGPLDLFVEDRMFKNYKEMRPLQLLSLCEMQKENLMGMNVADKNPGNFPNDIVRTTKILNMVSAMHLKEMYGVDFLPRYNASAEENELADMLFGEFKARRDYNETQGIAGDEYSYMMYVIGELGFRDCMKIVNEKDYCTPANSAPLRDEDEIDRQNKAFAEKHNDAKNSTESAMMTMYMLTALEYFDGMPMDKIKKIAIEIAMLGMGGINPANKSGYRIASIPGRDFGGYEMLAFYYVSWALAIPEKLNALQLPFENNYKMALKLFNIQKKK